MAATAPVGAECGGPGSCSEPHAEGGCSDIECCKQVCAFSPACCETSWDQDCVDLAIDLCGIFVYECDNPGPANDCAISPTATSFDVSYAFNSTNANTDGPPAGGCDYGKDLWYLVQAPDNGELRIDVTSDFDSTIGIYALGPSPAFDPNDLPDLLLGCVDILGEGAESATLSEAASAQWYLVQVAGFQSSFGVGDVTFTFLRRIFSTGNTAAVKFDPTNSGNFTTDFLGLACGKLDAANPQSWLAAPFTVPDPGAGVQWSITTIHAYGFSPPGVVNDSLCYKIWSRTSLLTPPVGADLACEGCVPFPVPSDIIGGAANEDHQIDIDVCDLPPGDYWLAVYADNASPPAVAANFAWLVNAPDGIPIIDAMGKPQAWRSQIQPVPGFVKFQFPATQLQQQPGLDPNDVYNVGFRILGVKNPLAQQLYAFGLLNTALGGAIAALDEGTLLVSDIGGSGEDGVRITLGEAEGWAAQFTDAPDLTVKGRVLTASMRGRVAGRDDQIIALARIEGTGDAAIAQVDFSGIGSPVSLLSLYDPEGVLLASYIVNNNDPIELTGDQGRDRVNEANLGEVRMICDPDKGSFGPWTNPIGATPPGGGPRITNVSTFTVEALDFASAPEFVSSGTIQGVNLGAIKISNEAVQKLGQLHTGLGEARLEAFGGGLAVTNVGSGGEDGVRVALDSTANFRSRWAPLELLEGGSLEFHTVGTLNGVPNQPLGFARVTRNAGVYEYSADYSELDSPTQLVMIYQDDVLIASHPNQSGIVAQSQAPPGGCGKGPDSPPCPITPPCIEVWFAEVTDIDVAGFDTVFGNRLLILSESDATVEALQAFTIVASDVSASGFAIAQESAWPSGGVCLGDLSADCTVDGADLGLLLGSWGAAGAADLDGSGVVDGSDLGLLLGAWGPCP